MTQTIIKFNSFRSSIQEHDMKYFGDGSNRVLLPLCRDGNARIHLEFAEPTAGEIQLFYVLKIVPSILEIDYHRRISLSFVPN